MNFKRDTPILNLLGLFLTLILSGCGNQSTMGNSSNTLIPPTSTNGTASTMAVAKSISIELSEIASCSPPCWNSIVVGKSTYAEIEELLKSDPNMQVAEPVVIEGEGILEVQRSYLSVNDIEQKERISFTFQRASIEPTIIVNSITFQGIPKQTLVEWIDALGEPSHVYGFIDPAPPHGNTALWVVRFVWLNQGVEIYESGFVPVPSIDSDLLIGDQLIIFEPTLTAYNAVMSRNDMESYLTPWVGYGTFEQYITDSGE